MSGETEKEVSAWTIDSLRYHLEQIATDLDKRYEQRFIAQEKAVEIQLASRDKEIAAALAAQKEAVNKSEASYDRRFEAVNEFRGQLSDQAALFMPRTEYDANHKALEDRVTALTDRMNRAEGTGVGTQQARANQRLDNGQLIAVVSTLIAAIAIAVTLILALNG